MEERASTRRDGRVWKELVAKSTGGVGGAGGAGRTGPVENDRRLAWARPGAPLRSWSLFVLEEGVGRFGIVRGEFYLVVISFCLLLVFLLFRKLVVSWLSFFA